MNRKRLMIVASLVLTVALGIAGTSMAYYISTQSAVNHLGVGTLTAEINENNSDTPQSSNPIEIENMTASKLVQVENKEQKNAVDAYVRVQLVPALKDENGNTAGADFTMPASIKDNKIEFVPFGTDKKDKLTITLIFSAAWNTGWHYYTKDNCFYYADVVKPGGKTAPLLEKVQFAGTDAENWKTRFQLDVLTDSIQADGKTAGGTPAAEEAWPIVKIGTDKKLTLK